MVDKVTKPPQPPATRKSRPRDLAEEHKPSRKVALNEVLRSLQDLVNNELATPPDRPAETTPPSTPTEADALPKSAAAQPKPETTATPVVPKSRAKQLRIPPEGLQQELELDATPAPPAAEPDFMAEPEPPPAVLAPPESIPAPEPAVELVAETTDTPVESAESLIAIGEAPQTNDTPVPSPVELLPESLDVPAATAEAVAEVDDLGEIPVLEDIIDFHEEHDAGAVPDASEARRVAIQVAARLNVELRKDGKPGLSSDVITRLVRLLGEALAKAAANMENNPPEEH